MNPASSPMNIHQQLRSLAVDLNAGKIPEQESLNAVKKYSDRLSSTDLIKNQDFKNSIKKVSDSVEDFITTPVEGKNLSINEDSVDSLETFAKKYEERQSVMKPIRNRILKVGGEIKNSTQKIKEELVILKEQAEKKEAEREGVEVAKSRLHIDVNNAEEIIERNRAEIKRLKEELNSSTFEKDVLVERLKEKENELEEYVKIVKEANDLTSVEQKSELEKKPEALAQEKVDTLLEAIKTEEESGNLTKEFILAGLLKLEEELKIVSGETVEQDQNAFLNKFLGLKKKDKKNRKVLGIIKVEGKSVDIFEREGSVLSDVYKILEDIKEEEKNTPTLPTPPTVATDSVSAPDKNMNERTVIMRHLENLNYGTDGKNVKKDLMAIADIYLSALKLDETSEIDKKIEEIKKYSGALQDNIRGNKNFTQLNAYQKSLIFLAQDFVLGDVVLDDDGKPKKVEGKTIRRENGVLATLYSARKKLIVKPKTTIPTSATTAAVTSSPAPSSSAALTPVLIVRPATPDKIPKLFNTDNVLKNLIHQFGKKSEGINTVTGFINRNPELRGSNFEVMWRNFNGEINPATQKALLASLKSSLGFEVVEKYEIENFSEGIERLIKNKINIDTGTNSDCEYFTNLYISMNARVNIASYFDAAQMEENMSSLYNVLKRVDEYNNQIKN